VRNEDAFRDLVELIESARAFGYQETADGARLFGRVPLVGAQAWLHVTYPGLDPDEMVELADQIERPLASDYAWWLGRMNGITLFSGALEFCGLVRVRSRSIGNRQPYDLMVEGEVQRRVLKAGPEMFFFGVTGVSLGSRFYLDARTGEVHRCARNSAKPLQSWSSIAELISTETPRLAKLFDKTGRCAVDNELIWTP